VYHFVRYQRVPRMKPDSQSPSRKRVVRNPARFLMKAWKVATRPHARSWHGSQISAPIWLYVSLSPRTGLHEVRPYLLNEKIRGDVSNANPNKYETGASIDSLLVNGKIFHHIVGESIANVASGAQVRLISTWLQDVEVGIPVKIQSEEHEHYERYQIEIQSPQNVLLFILVPCYFQQSLIELRIALTVVSGSKISSCIGNSSWKGCLVGIFS
jgi:hypothetical protein